MVTHVRAHELPAALLAPDEVHAEGLLAIAQHPVGVVPQPVWGRSVRKLRAGPRDVVAPLHRVEVVTGQGDSRQNQREQRDEDDGDA